MSVAVVYFAAARLGLGFVSGPEGIAPVWLPEGIFLCAILLTQRSARPHLVAVLAVTDLAAELLQGTPPVVAVLYALALTLDAVLSAWLLTRFVATPVMFKRPLDLVAFLGLVVVLSNGTTGLIAAMASQLLPGTSFWMSWIQWTAADGIGNLVVSPFILSWAAPERRPSWDRRRTLEGAALYAMLVIVTSLVFGGLPARDVITLLLPYSTLPFLFWAALRFGMRGVTSAVLLMAGVIIALDAGPHLLTGALAQSGLDAILVVQLYLAVVAVPALLLATLVAERKGVEESLRRSQFLLSKAEQIAGVGSWQHDVASGEITWSDEVYRIFGFEPQAFAATYDAFLEAVHPDDRKTLDAAYTTSLTDEMKPYDVEHRIVSKTGEVRHVHEKSEHVTDGSGRVVGSIGMVHDITERKAAEAALRERNSYIETILENAPIGFGVNTVHDGKAVFVGGRFEDIYGVPRGSLHSVEEYFEKVFRDPVLREQLRARMLADMASGDPARMRWEDLPITSPSGEPRFVTAINIPLLDRNLMVSTVQDVTARHRAETALRESEARFRTVIEQAGDGFELLDGEGRFVDVNDATCRQLGYERDELLRLTVTDVDPAATRERYATTFRSITSGTSITSETTHRRKDGTTFPVEVNTAVVRLRGVAMALRLVRDTTERRRAEAERTRLQAQLLQAQKLESIGQLAGGVAHDFNNVLSAIVGYGDLLRAMLPEEAAAREYVGEILAAATRASGLTRSLLAFSRKEAIDPKNLDLNAVIRKVHKFLSRIIGEDISLVLSLCTEPLVVLADETQLEQVVMNLATNARDAMPKGGSLRIGTDRCDGSALPPEAAARAHWFARLTVTDTGTGMDEQTLARIFDPFFTTKEVGRGTGLGLAIVYGVVKQSRGHINVYSEPGRGTTFKIYLPLASSAALVESAAPVAPVRGGSETILLVEDDAAIRRLSRRVLSSYGYNVIEAADGDVAMELFRTHAAEIRLVITDVIIPKRSGADFVAEAASAKPGLKVIFTSGYPSDHIQRQGLVQEAIHFVPKPSPPEDLLRKVREVLDAPAA